ncbi:MAG: DUF4350 domain-containing protein [Bacteroidetes bacterium]|nr:DUF4350 domain-containing protein [Bacteroidota bacterium]
MRSFRVLFAIGVALIILYIVSEYNRPRPLDWRPTFSFNDKIPYGAYVLYNELHHIFPGSQITGTNDDFYDLFHNKPDTGSNYIIVTNFIRFTKYDFKELSNYISAGNSVFVAAENFGMLGDTLNFAAEAPPVTSTNRLNFTNTNLKRANGYKFGNGLAVGYFARFDTTKVTVLAKNEDGKSTLIKYRFGKGSLCLCADPKLFTN